MQEHGWVGMPGPTEEQIEADVVSIIHTLIVWKKRYDRPDAKWTVGTTGDPENSLDRKDLPLFRAVRTGWTRGIAKRAAQEIAEYHGMVLEETAHDDDTWIYVYVDRPPTRQERARREKEPLTLKQKRLFRKIRRYVEQHGLGPTRSECMRMSGHRSATTTNGFLEILVRKNWIILEPEQRRIELI